MRRCAGGIPHVVQAIEEGDEIETFSWIIRRGSDLEFCIGRDAILGGVPIRGFNRAWVEVVADKLRVRESLCHQHRRYAMAASDIGDPRTAFELGNHTV